MHLFKKISPLIVTIMLILFIYPTAASADGDWVHSPEPYDYHNGLLDDPFILDGFTTNVERGAYDNDLKTFSSNEINPQNFEFSTPINLKSIYSHVALQSGSTSSDNIRLRLRKINGESNFVNLNKRGYTKIEVDGVVSIETDFKASNLKLNEIDFFGSYQKDQYPPVVVKNVASDENSISVLFDKPDEAIAVDIWLDGQKVERTTKEKYVFENLQPDTEYELMFVNYYGDDNYGRAVRTNVTTKKEMVKDVQDLEVKAKSHRQVNLNWENPDQSNFSHVTIYRDELQEKKSLLKRLMPSASAAEEPSKLFETNGTYFIDHSVKASTSYEYLVTTTDVDGNETAGVKKTVTTPKKPNPESPNSEIGKTDDGDYLVKWTNPEEGKVLIIVGGKDYVTVDAKDGNYLIPGADMVYDWMQRPDVKVVAIDGDGDQSSAVKPGKPGSTDNGGNAGGGGFGGSLEDMGMDAKDVLKGTMGFIKILAPLIILALIIVLVPVITSVIKKSAATRQRHRAIKK